MGHESSWLNFCQALMYSFCCPPNTLNGSLDSSPWPRSWHALAPGSPLTSSCFPHPSLCCRHTAFLLVLGRLRFIPTPEPLLGSLSHFMEVSLKYHFPKRPPSLPPQALFSLLALILFFTALDFSEVTFHLCIMASLYIRM